jgi:hypothetical protein
MMNTMNDSTRLVDDLAAQWTEPALEILKAGGVPAISIDMELETWRTLKEVLQAEIRWQRAFRFSTLVSLSMLMEQVLRKAALLVAKKFVPVAVTPEFRLRIRSLVRGRSATPAERRLYIALVSQPGLKAAFKLPSRTDYFPRLHVSAVG